MMLYLVAFTWLFAKGARATQQVGPVRAAVLGVLAFATYQAVFFIFNR